MNKLIACVILMLTISCGGTVKEPELIPPAPEPPKTYTLNGDTWQITLPNEFKLKRSPTPIMVVSAFTTDQKRMALLIKQTFDDTLEEYVKIQTEHMSKPDIKIVQSTQGYINDLKYVKMVALNNNLIVSRYDFVKSGNAYSFVCGGFRGEDVDLMWDCQQMADSIHLK